MTDGSYTASFGSSNGRSGIGFVHIRGNHLSGTVGDYKLEGELYTKPEGGVAASVKGRRFIQCGDEVFADLEAFTLALVGKIRSDLVTLDGFIEEHEDLEVGVVMTLAKEQAA